VIAVLKTVVTFNYKQRKVHIVMTFSFIAAFKARTCVAKLFFMSLKACLELDISD
jgi:hypothetical protein